MGICLELKRLYNIGGACPGRNIGPKHQPTEFRRFAISWLFLFQIRGPAFTLLRRLFGIIPSPHTNGIFRENDLGKDCSGAQHSRELLDHRSWSVANTLLLNRTFTSISICTGKVYDVTEFLDGTYGAGTIKKMLIVWFQNTRVCRWESLEDILFLNTLLRRKQNHTQICREGCYVRYHNLSVEQVPNLS